MIKKTKNNSLKIQILDNIKIQKEIKTFNLITLNYLKTGKFKKLNQPHLRYSLKRLKKLQKNKNIKIKRFF